MIEEYKNLNDELCVLITYEDGSSWSGLKSTWDELEAQREQSGTL